MKIRSHPGNLINKSHPLAQGLVGCWMLNEGGGLKAIDSLKINIVDGALVNCVFQQSDEGNCVNFNGTSSSVNIGSTVANYPNLNLPGVMSVIATINPAVVSVGTRSIVADCNAGGTLLQWNFEMNRTAAKLSFGQGNANVATGTVSLVANRWYRVAVTRSGVAGAWSIKIYINGVLDNTTATATNPGVQQGAAIGKLGSASALFFSGLINKVYVYNRTLTDSEIGQDFVNPSAIFI